MGRRLRRLGTSAATGSAGQLAGGVSLVSGEGAMADEIDDPRSGQRLVFRRKSGDALEVDLFVRRGAFVREHLHPAQEETFVGVVGTFVLDVAGERRTLRPGDEVVIPARTPHGFESAAEDAQLLVTVRPAPELGGYFRDFLTLSREGRLRIPARVGSRSRSSCSRC